MSVMQQEDASILRVITSEIGDTDNSLLASVLPILWTSFADKALIAPRLQEHYTRRSAIDVVIATLRQTADVSQGTDLSEKQSQWVKNLQDMRLSIQTEILVVEHRARALRSPATGQLFTVSPSVPFDVVGVLPGNVVWASVSNPADPYFRGDLNANPYGVQLLPQATTVKP